MAGACRDDPPAPAAIDAAPSAATSTPPSTGAAPPPPPIAPPRSGPPCRVVASEDGAPPSADPTSWLAIPGRGNTTVRVLETGRELRVEGPARVRPCRGSLTLLAAGSIVGLPSSGEAPGAETWVGTPCATARFGAGAQRVSVTARSCTVSSSMGVAFVMVADDVRARAEVVVDGGAPDAGAVELPAEAGWLRVDARRSLTLTGPFRESGRAAPAVARCEEAVTAANAVAAKMMDAGGAIGDLAAVGVDRRRAARGACAVAAARLAALGPGPLPPSLAERVDQALSALDGAPALGR